MESLSPIDLHSCEMVLSFKAAIFALISEKIVTYSQKNLVSYHKFYYETNFRLILILKISTDIF